MGYQVLDDDAAATPAAPASSSRYQLIDQPPATAGDRVQAAEGGILKGAAYLAGMPLDNGINLWNLGKAGAGYAYSKLSGNPVPSSLEVTDGVSPVGTWIAKQLDKSPITTTQPTRPDDTASRYLNTAGSVIPGVLTGGESSIPQVLTSSLKAAAPAAAAQYVGEHPLFKSDAANNAATVLTQALGTVAAGKLPGPGSKGPAIRSPANDAVAEGQQAGYVFPPATTNPTGANRAIESIAGTKSVTAHASIENQGTTNQNMRTVLTRAPSEDTRPITPDEIVQAKRNAAPGYDAVKTAGTLQAPPDLQANLQAALKKQSGAAALDPSLENTALTTTVTNLGKNKTFDAGNAISTISVLREKAAQAYANGDTSSGAAYKAVSRVLEDAVDSGLSAKGQNGAQMLADYRDSRQQFARIGTIEENRNPLTGNVQAQKLAAAFKNNEPMDGVIAATARAAGQAPHAFAEPTSTAGSNHLGFWGSLGGAALAGTELGHMLPGEHGAVSGAAAAALPIAYQAGRWGARKYALGAPGQSGALQRGADPSAAARLAGALTSGPGILPATSP